MPFDSTEFFHQPTADDTLDLLIEARRLINRGWAKGTFARTRDGRNCGIDNPNAVKFCLVGAIMRAKLNLGRGSPEEAWMCLGFEHSSPRAIQQRSVFAFNDGGTKKRVLLRLDNTIGNRRGALYAAPLQLAE